MMLNDCSLVSDLVSRRVHAVRAPGVAMVLVSALAAHGCSSDPAVEKQRYLESANRYAEQGKLGEAVIDYRNALQVDPRFAEARLKIAQTYARLGDGSNALREYVRAADLLPENADVQLTAGSYLLAAGQMDSALARADAALAKQPENIAGHVLRGSALAGLNELDRALSAMEEAVRLDPERGASYTHLGLVEVARGKQDAAEAALKKAVSLDRKSVNSQLALGRFYWSVGRHSETERAFDAALAIDPKHIAAHRAMALLAISRRRLADAEKHLKRVVEIAKTPSAVFALSDFYVASGRPKEAIALLAPLATGTPNVADARHRFVAATAASGDRAGAYRLVNEILTENPRDLLAQLQSGQLLLEDGKNDEALARVQEAVAAAPASVPAQFALGRVYATRGDLAGAEKAFQEVVKLNPHVTAAHVELSKLQLLTARPQESLASAEAAAADQPNSADVRLTLVRSLLVGQKFAEADREIQSLLRGHANDARVHVQHGLLAAARGETGVARASFERALSLESRSLDALSGMIALDLRARDHAAARQRLEQRLGAGVPTPDVLLLAARTYASMNDLDAAERMLRRSIDIAPSLLPAYSMLGQVYLRQQKLDEARARFDLLADKESKPVGALTMSGMILQAQGNTAMAKQRFERALTIDSQAPVAANNLAWIYAEANESLDQAVNLAVTASQALPESAEVLDTLGWVYYKNKQPALAVPPLMRAVQKTPDNPLYRYHLGLAYEQAGDAARSRESLTRALAIKSDFAGADEARRALTRLKESGTQ
jgi:tetratricopeptide (TPR) repeat protein